MAPVTPITAIIMAIAEIVDLQILHWQEKKKTILFPNLQSQKMDLDLSSSQRFLKQYRSFVNTIIMIISLILLVPTLSQHKKNSCQIF